MRSARYFGRFRALDALSALTGQPGARLPREALLTACIHRGRHAGRADRRDRRVAGGAGVLDFVAVAALAVYTVVRGQRRHIRTLRTLLRDQPDRISSIRVLVASALPYTSWTVDDGTAKSGLHFVIVDDTGATWVLPLSRKQVPPTTAALARRCPRAVVEPSPDQGSGP